MSGATVYTPHSSRRFQILRRLRPRPPKNLKGRALLRAPFRRKNAVFGGDEKKARATSLVARAPEPATPQRRTRLEVKAPSARTFVHLAVRLHRHGADHLRADSPRDHPRHGLRPKPRGRPRLGGAAD